MADQAPPAPSILIAMARTRPQAAAQKRRQKAAPKGPKYLSSHVTSPLDS